MMPNRYSSARGCSPARGRDRLQKGAVVSGRIFMALALAREFVAEAGAVRKAIF